MSYVTTVDQSRSFRCIELPNRSGGYEEIFGKNRDDAYNDLCEQCNGINGADWIAEVEAAYRDHFETGRCHLDIDHDAFAGHMYTYFADRGWAHPRLLRLFAEIYNVQIHMWIRRRNNIAYVQPVPRFESYTPSLHSQQNYNAAPVVCNVLYTSRQEYERILLVEVPAVPMHEQTIAPGTIQLPPLSQLLHSLHTHSQNHHFRYDILYAAFNPLYIRDEEETSNEVEEEDSERPLHLLELDLEEELLRRSLGEFNGRQINAAITHNTDTMMEYLNAGCRVVHISAHSDGIHLCLERHDYPVRAALITSNDFLQRYLSNFGGTMPILVVLSACHSQLLVTAFHNAGVRFVIAVHQQIEVEDMNARSFLGGFYGALLRGETLSKALALANTRIEGVTAMPDCTCSCILDRETSMRIRCRRSSSKHFLTVKSVT